MSAISEPLSPPEPSARTIGIVYLLYPLTALLGGLLARGLVVSTNPAQTATNLLAHEGLYRAAFAVDLLGNVLYIAVTALLYGYFRRVNPAVSLIAAFCSLAGCIVQIMGELLTIAPLVMLENAHLATLFSAPQIQAAALLSLALHTETLRISAVLFAFFDLLTGYLIVRSTFVPTALGLLMMAAGVGWLTILWPPTAVALYAVLLPLGALAEFALMLWLILKGTGPRSPSAPLG